VNPSLAGPNQLPNSGKVDAIKGTITLPLYEGYMTGTKIPVLYILTDTDDPGVAAELGLNFSAKLEFAAIGSRTANFGPDNVLYFDAGAVDFSPHHILIPGSPTPFPPAAGSQPGSVDDANYSPYVSVTNQGGTIYNAPILAYNVTAKEINFPKDNPDYSKVHDEVLAIDTVHMTVT
jgi:hypothetical protein